MIFSLEYYFKNPESGSIDLILLHSLLIFLQEYLNFSLYNVMQIQLLKKLTDLLLLVHETYDAAFNCNYWYLPEANFQIILM